MEQVCKHFRFPSIPMPQNEGIVVVYTCGGYIKHVFGNNSPLVLTILDEDVDNDRKIGTISFPDGLRSYLWYGDIGSLDLSRNQKRLLSMLGKYIKEHPKGDKLVGRVLFRGGPCWWEAVPDIQTAWRAERAYRAIMMSGYAESLLDEYMNGPGDFIADIMHLCDCSGLSFDGVMEQAALHYNEEVAEERAYRRRKKK